MSLKDLLLYLPKLILKTNKNYKSIKYKLKKLKKYITLQNKKYKLFIKL